MQLLRLDGLRGRTGRDLADAIRMQLDDCAARRLMTAVQREAVRPSMLAAFFAGDAGRRMQAAEELHREWPFNVMLRVEEAMPGEQDRFAGEEILVQGLSLIHI